MAATRTVQRSAGLGRLDPLRALWRLLTNVKFAMLLVATAAAVGMLGVLIPQLPAEMRGNPAAQSAWFALQRDDYGSFAEPMRRWGLFDIYRQWWFFALWGVIIASVTVCTVSRIRPTLRSIHRPQRQVPDSYFQAAQHRASFEVESPAGLEAALRRRHYRVERIKRSRGATYLFAERFGWSQYGTFVSHLALIMLLVGGLLTVMAGFDRTLALAEDSGAAPLFDTPGRDQIFVGMDDAVRGIDGDGNIVDFRSFLEIRRGDETVTCVATVNDPCTAFGYRFHQAAFFNDLARIEIRGPDGRLLYADILDFNAEVAAAPFLRVTDADGAALFAEVTPQLGTDGALALSRLAFPGVAGGGLDETVQVPVAWSIGDGEATVYVGDGFGELQPLQPGESATLFSGSDFAFEVLFEGMAGVPAIEIADMPGARGALVVVQMPEGAGRRPYLLLDGVDDEPLLLAPGSEATTASGYSYRFVGRADGAGINVKRDPGDTFIFIAVVVALAGLAMTFYIPRRRLWARISGDRVQLAGIAGRATRLDRELRRLGTELGARDSGAAVDTEERW